MDDFLDVEKQKARLKRLLENFSEKDKELINEALELAKKKHAGQKRDEGGPYVIHCIRMACSLIEEMDVKEPEIICGALLHDTVEDTDLDLKVIVQKFGERIGEIVSALTRIKKPDETEENRYERKHEHFLKTMRADKEIRIIKACDYIDNMRSWPCISENHPSVKKFPRWFKEASDMYVPLAKSVSPEMAEKTREALNKAHAKWNDYLKKL